MKINYRVEGEGPSLVLSHSLGTSLELWDPQMSALPGFQVLRYDHRGHGGSDCPPGPYTIEAIASDLLALLDSLGLERVSFCGLSIGGAVGMWLAANEPSRIDRLVLACTAVRFGSPADWHARAALVRAEGVAPVVETTMGRWFTPRMPPDVVSHFEGLLLSTPAEGYAASCEALADWDFEDGVTAVSAPTLVIAGAEDPSTPPAQGRLIADAIHGSRLVVIDGAAHLANLERPEAFGAALVGHLRVEEAVA
jgi:3-oxoadipate enol-lactonase